ncbi:MAG TPA: phosphoglycerate dehydrogenase [Anaerolineaceae bacterium]|nr:phosphoglycerate dehydrogenase [Anaerolineaceae bacterium]HOH19132.1 phosphoglycerate dehydrogenase [Anaerolineaceae bacterium]HQL39174.1 phosphoglycerate dehydrogenase [Anaerolineaceae bacterium]HQP61233.1 phosphoglycerate dehydrogenase [Anaerolineaceae bacterium]
MATVLFSAPYMIPFVDRFRPILAHYGVELIEPVVHERMGEDELLAYAGQFDGTICGDDRYTPRVLDRCAPRLRVISKWGTGIDSIDKAYAETLGISVRNTPNAFTLPVADSVLGYILAFARRQPWMDRAIKSGEWQKIPGRSLSECTLGVIGLGNIGKAVIRRARGFGMRLLGNDIIPIAPDFLAENNVTMLPLQELMEQADFISVNCDLNPTSHHLINRQTLSWARPGAILINTARGPIVEEAALVEALQSGRLGGAALDVFEVEPLPADSPLTGMDQVMLAPHNSNSSPAAWERVHWNTIRNLLQGLNIPCDDLARWMS